MLKGLPLAYNRDLQEDKAPLFDSVDTVDASLDVLSRACCRACACAPTACARPPRPATRWPPSWPTTCASKGVPFREAHGIVGAIVQSAIAARPAARGASALAELRALLARFRARRAALADASRPR